MEMIRQNTGSMKKRSKKSCSSCEDPGNSEHLHPDHSYALHRLSRDEGQIRGIQEVIRSRRYCVDILIQMRAAMAALRSVELDVFQSHIKQCVRETMKTKNSKAAEKKIEELTELLVRRTVI